MRRAADGCKVCVFTVLEIYVFVQETTEPEQMVNINRGHRRGNNLRQGVQVASVKKDIKMN